MPTNVNRENMEEIFWGGEALTGGHVGEGGSGCRGWRPTAGRAQRQQGQNGKRQNVGHEAVG